MEKKDIEKVEREKVENKVVKPFQIQMSTGSGKTYLLSMLYGNTLHKKFMVNSDGSIRIDEVKKEEKPKETRKGWRNYSDPDKDKNKIGWVK